MKSFNTNTARIMLVDDQRANLQLLEDILETEGYTQLRSLEDSRQVLQAFDEFRPDLLILDLMMPHRDGFGVMEDLRPRLSYETFLPILVLTADSNPETRRRALASGARDFLTKPLNALEVLLRVRNLLEIRNLNQTLEVRVREQTRQVFDQARLIDAAREAIISCDPNGQVRSWNRGAEQLYGWKKHEAIGGNINAMFAGRQTAEWVVARQKFAKDGQWNGELKHLTKEGREVIVESRWTLVPGIFETPETILIIDGDVTEQRRLEVQYLRAQRMESIGLLAGGIAHDLNNVLAPIMMGIELLTMTTEDPENRAMLQTMSETTQRGADLVKQILTFARGAVGKREPIHLGPLILELIKLLRRTFPKSLVIESVIENDLWMVNADSTQIHQVLTNLCLNARDAMPKGGTLTIRARNITNSGIPVVRLEVGDTGTGIPAEVIEKIFDPFFTTKEVGKGTGLGLSTVQGIVSNHGGSLRIDSNVGHGTIFTIELPAIT